MDYETSPYLERSLDISDVVDACECDRAKLKACLELNPNCQVPSCSVEFSVPGVEHNAN